MQCIDARSPGPKYAECGTTDTPNAWARVITLRISVTPPTLVMLGCAYVTAPTSNMRLKSEVVAFSPAAIASPTWSSGGHTGPAELLSHPVPHVQAAAHPIPGPTLQRCQEIFRGVPDLALRCLRRRTARRIVPLRSVEHV